MSWLGDCHPRAGAKEPSPVGPTRVGYRATGVRSSSPLGTPDTSTFLPLAGVGAQPRPSAVTIATYHLTPTPHQSELPSHPRLGLRHRHSPLRANMEREWMPATMQHLTSNRSRSQRSGMPTSCMDRRPNRARHVRPLRDQRQLRVPVSRRSDRAAGPCGGRACAFSTCCATERASLAIECRVGASSKGQRSDHHDQMVAVCRQCRRLPKDSLYRSNH